MYTDSHRKINGLTLHIFNLAEEDDVEVDQGILFPYEGDYNVSGLSVTPAQPTYVHNSRVEGNGLAALLLTDKYQEAETSYLPLISYPENYGRRITAVTRTSISISVIFVEEGHSIPRENEVPKLRYFIEGNGTIRPEAEDNWSVVSPEQDHIVRGYNTFFEAYLEG